MTTNKPDEARPATLDDLKKLIISFNEAGIDYLLIGGYALFAHGYQRATTDIDFIFPATVEAGILVREALMSLPEGVASEIDPAWFIDGETIRVADEFIVDIMFNACGETYESLSKYQETTEVDGIPVKTISLEGLLLTKQSVRGKDISDRNILERAIIHMDNDSLGEAEKIAVQKDSFALADVKAKKSYSGKILGVTDFHVVQNLGMAAVIHRKADLEHIPNKDEMVDILYVNGRGKVEPPKSLGICD